MPPPLHLEVRGSGPRLALVHGFTQSARAWGPVAARLAERFTVLALDAPGHGRSHHVPADLAAGARLMADTVGTPAAWLGYSMGGRFALQLALGRAEMVERLVLVSTTGGIDDPAERAVRRAADDALADRIEIEGLEAFLRRWLAQPLFANLPPSAAELEGRLDGTPSGLASSLHLAGAGTQEPVWGQLAGLDMPILVVAGALDSKYRELAARLVAAIGDNAELRVIEAAGHACHLERPDAFVAAVAPWLEDHQSPKP